jgi:hypothetical protein
MKTAWQQLVLNSFASKRGYPSRALREILPLCIFMSFVVQAFVVHQPQRTQRWPRQEFTPNCGKLYREIPLMDAIRLRKKPMMFVYN